jgi:hypothetical protein
MYKKKGPEGGDVYFLRQEKVETAGNVGELKKIFLPRIIKIVYKGGTDACIGN